MIRAEPLTRRNFARYGEVIEADPATAREINGGFTTRFDALARCVSDQDVVISLFRGRPRPLSIGMLERHPLGSQAFIPLNGRDWLVVVGATAEVSALRAFRARGDQGVNYRAGCWHHPLLVLGGEQDFLVVDRKGTGSNLDEVVFDLAEQVSV